jgi:FkbM family methyltransferase
MININLAKTDFGNFMGYEHDVLFQSLVENKFHDPEVGAFIKENIKPQDTCVDIGANIGTMSVFLSRHCNKLYSIEPQSNIYLALCGNLFINQCNNVTPMNIAAFSENKSFSIASKEKLDGWVGDIHEGYDKVKSFGSVSLEEKKDGDIKGKRLDEIIKEKVDFIKVDAEGGDLDALMGCQKIIENYSPHIIFEFHESCSKKCYNRSWDDYCVFFKENNYNMTEISERDFLAQPKAK